MASATLRKLVTDVAVKDTAYIDYLLNKSGILKTINVIPSSDGEFHKYKQVIAVPTGQFRNVGSGYDSASTVNDKIAQLNMKIIGAYQTEDKVICDQKGKVEYFKQERPAFMEGMGQSISKQVIYGTNSTFGNVAGWEGWHEIAKANGKEVDGGGASGSTTTIFVVRYGAQSGLVIDSNILNKGSLFNTDWVNGGDMTIVSGMPAYQVLYEGSMGILSGGATDVARYHSLQTGHLPTAANMDLCIDYVNGDSDGRTFIYANRTGRRFLKTLKNTKFELGAADKNYDTRIDYWDGIPIVTDENILSTETSALD